MFLPIQTKLPRTYMYQSATSKLKAYPVKGKDIFVYVMHGQLTCSISLYIKAILP